MWELWTGPIAQCLELHEHLHLALTCRLFYRERFVVTGWDKHVTAADDRVNQFPIPRLTLHCSRTPVGFNPALRHLTLINDQGFIKPDQPVVLPRTVLSLTVSGVWDITRKKDTNASCQLNTVVVNHGELWMDSQCFPRIRTFMVVDVFVDLHDIWFEFPDIRRLALRELHGRVQPFTLTHLFSRIGVVDASALKHPERLTHAGARLWITDAHLLTNLHTLLITDGEPGIWEALAELPALRRLITIDRKPLVRFPEHVRVEHATRRDYQRLVCEIMYS